MTPPPTACRPSRATISTTSRPWSCCRATRRCCAPRPSTSWWPRHVANGNAATLLTSVLDDPTGYGRVVRAADDRVLRIVEQGEAGPDELAVQEVATSIYAFRREVLGPALRHVSPDNAQGEFYLTDVVGVLGGMGHRIGSVQAPADETQGVNDRWQLALAERELRSRTNRAWLLNGVTMLDPRQTFIDVTVQRRPRRHAVSRHDPAGQHRHRRRVRDRSRHPARRLRGRPRLPGPAHRRRRGRDRRRRQGRPVCPSAGGIGRRG